MWERYDIDSLDERSEARVARLCRDVVPWLERYFRSEVRGMERIPAGAGLYVGNHSSGMITPDTFLFGAAVYRSGGMANLPYGLGHEVAISLPLLHQIIVPLGAVRASHENAHRLFAQGSKVIVYPGGDLDAMRPYRDRNRVVFGGRRGYIRLALREGVPIIPVVTAGSHETFIVLDRRNWAEAVPGLAKALRIKVWPTTLSIPWGVTFGVPIVYWPYPARIRIEIAEPIRFERSGEDAARDVEYVAACAERVESVMQRTLDRLVAERSQPRNALPQ